MSEITAERRARINRLKKIIVISNFTILFIAILSCIILLIRVISLSDRIETLENELEQERQNDRKQENESGDDMNASVSEGDTESYTKPEAPDIVYDKTVYLTFDDGPSSNTVNILDILDRYGVKATFFVNGREDEDSKNRYREIVNRGNTLGMHSYTHEFSAVYASLDSFDADTVRIHDYLYGLTGLDIKLYRFPGGSSTTQTSNMLQYIEYLNGKGYVYFDWNVSSGDAVPVPLSSEEIINNVMSGIDGKDMAVVLMHDAAVRDTTVEALPIIIEKLLDKGYAILPITESTPPVHHTVN